MSQSLSGGRAFNLYRSRRYEEAIQQDLKTLDLDPSYEPSTRRLAATYARLGRAGEALAATERAEELMGGGPSFLRVRVLAILGRVDEAEQVHQDLRGSTDAPTLGNVSMAELYSLLGETDAALSLLEQAYEARAGDLVWVNVHPAFDSLRHHPRFQALLERMNFPE